MPVSSGREIAYRILRRVESGRAYAVDCLQDSEVTRLREVDRRLATELVMGVLRWSGGLDLQIERLSGKPLSYFDSEVATILRLGLYQVLFLTKIPKSAAVNESVELTKLVRKRSATGLVNAVLRKSRPLTRPAIGTDYHNADPEAFKMACRSAPAWMFERWSRSFGPEVARALAWRSVQAPTITLRVSPGQGSLEAVQRELSQQGVVTRPGRYGRLALQVESGNVQNTKVVQEGRAFIQEEASQLVAELVRVEPGACVLDLCAAPGIKTGQLAAMLGRGPIVACDLSARRLRTMTQLLSKAVPHAVRLDLVRLDAAHELPFRISFDRILLDVPCSGTGTMARNPEIKSRLKLSDLPRLAEIQRRILRNALEVLAPGGRLVYATCSLEPEENERVVESVLKEKTGFRTLASRELASEFPQLASLFDPGGYFRTRPDLHFIDGFFAAVIVRS